MERNPIGNAPFFVIVISESTAILFRVYNHRPEPGDAKPCEGQ